MRAIVCGGREFANWYYLERALDAIHANRKISAVIHGGARGADTIAAYWAFKSNVERIKFPAKWREYGRAAGAMRNRQMLEEGKPDIVIAFPGGRGTANMIEQAKAAGIPVIKLDGINYDAAQKAFGENRRAIA